jgi:hypothetical protein
VHSVDVSRPESITVAPGHCPGLCPAFTGGGGRVLCIHFQLSRESS